VQDSQHPTPAGASAPRSDDATAEVLDDRSVLMGRQGCQRLETGNRCYSGKGQRLLNATRAGSTSDTSGWRQLFRDERLVRLSCCKSCHDRLPKCARLFG
jgi:hypothetical protein